MTFQLSDSNPSSHHYPLTATMTSPNCYAAAIAYVDSIERSIKNLTLNDNQVTLKRHEGARARADSALNNVFSSFSSSQDDDELEEGEIREHTDAMVEGPDRSFAPDAVDDPMEDVSMEDAPIYALGVPATELPESVGRSSIMQNNASSPALLEPPLADEVDPKAARDADGMTTSANVRPELKHLTDHDLNKQSECATTPYGKHLNSQSARLAMMNQLPPRRAPRLPPWRSRYLGRHGASAGRFRGYKDLDDPEGRVWELPERPLDSPR